jgi:hypothetical protein
MPTQERPPQPLKNPEFSDKYTLPDGTRISKEAEKRIDQERLRREAKELAKINIMTPEEATKLVEAKKKKHEEDQASLNAVRQKIETIGSEKKEQENEIKIPRGWTYLKHGTNFVNWVGTDMFNADEIEMKKELSVITKEDWEKDAKLSGDYDTTKNYSRASRPKEMSEEQFAQLNKPFEIRVLFYKNHIHQKTDPEYAAKLDEKKKDIILRYYLMNFQHGRHPVVPRKEKIIKIDHKVENGVDVFYFVPQAVLEDYEKEAGLKINRKSETS